MKRAAIVTVSAPKLVPQTSTFPCPVRFTVSWGTSGAAALSPQAMHATWQAAISGMESIGVSADSSGRNQTELGPQHRLLVDEHHHMEQQPPHRHEQHDRGRSL